MYTPLKSITWICTMSALHLFIYGFLLPLLGSRRFSTRSRLPQCIAGRSGSERTPCAFEAEGLRVTDLFYFWGTPEYTASVTASMYCTRHCLRTALRAVATTQRYVTLQSSSQSVTYHRQRLTVHQGLTACIFKGRQPVTAAGYSWCNTCSCHCSLSECWRCMAVKSVAMR